MKENIHPKYVESKISCACGNTFITKSIKPEIKLDICSKCHPFFTGTQKIIDTAGRVEKFTKKYKEAKPAAKVKVTAKSKKEKKVSKRSTLRKVLSSSPKKGAAAKLAEKSKPAAGKSAKPKSEAADKSKE